MDTPNAFPTWASHLSFLVTLGWNLLIPIPPPRRHIQPLSVDAQAFNPRHLLPCPEPLRKLLWPEHPSFRLELSNVPGPSAPLSDPSAQSSFIPPWQDPTTTEHSVRWTSAISPFLESVHPGQFLPHPLVKVPPLLPRPPEYSLGLSRCPTAAAPGPRTGSSYPSTCPVRVQDLRPCSNLCSVPGPGIFPRTGYLLLFHLSRRPRPEHLLFPNPGPSSLSG